MNFLLILITFLFFSMNDTIAARKKQGKRKSTSCTEQVMRNFETNRFSDDNTNNLPQPSLSEEDFKELFGLSFEEARNHPLANKFEIIKEVGGFLQSPDLNNSTRNGLYQALAAELNRVNFETDSEVFKIISKSVSTAMPELSEEELLYYTTHTVLKAKITTMFSIVPNNIFLSENFAEFLSLALISKSESIIATTTTDQRKHQLTLDFKKYAEEFLEELDDEKSLKALIRHSIDVNEKGDFREMQAKTGLNLKEMTNLCYDFLIRPDSTNSNSLTTLIKDTFYDSFQYMVLNAPSIKVAFTPGDENEKISDLMKKYEVHLRKEQRIPPQVTKVLTQIKFYYLVGIYPIEWTSQSVKKLVFSQFQEIVYQVLSEVKQKRSSTSKIKDQKPQDIIEPYYYRVNIGKKGPIEEKKNPNKRKNSNTYEVQEIDEEESFSNNKVGLISLNDNSLILHKLIPYSNNVKKDLRKLPEQVVTEFHSSILPKILSTPKEVGEHLGPLYPRTWLKTKDTINGTAYRFAYEITEDGVQIIAIGKRENFYKTVLPNRLP